MLFKRLPLHGIQVVLNSMGHMGIDIVMQQDDAFTEFTIIVFDLGVQLLKCLTVTVCIDKSSNRISLMSLWSCLDWFSTWYAILMLHYNVVGTVTCAFLHKCQPVQERYAGVPSTLPHSAAQTGFICTRVIDPL